jgi:imidazolonepropionase
MSATRTVCDRIWRNAQLVTLAPSRPGLGVVAHGAVAASGGRIVYAGPADEMPSDLDAREMVDCAGRLITPGLIDCHTHLVYAGDRAGEFELRLAGVSYEALARAGGGILSTVQATRSASAAQLMATALPRLDALIAEGITTIEIKSGYGLSRDQEIKLLRVAKALQDHRRIDVVTTLLAAHALPPEYADDADGYVRAICDDILPAVAQLGVADAVDAFCEGIGFSPDQVSRIFAAAAALGLPVKLHAEQLSNLHGAEMAARFGALSADHLEHLDEAGVAAMAAANMVAVLLPGAYFFMRETHRPPIAALRAHGVAMAIATDCNPGTSPLTSLLLAMNMAAVQFQMTVDECIAGVTREAAQALGRGGEIGTIEPGKYCDLAIWNIEQPAELVHRMGFNPLHARIWRGQ